MRTQQGKFVCYLKAGIILFWCLWYTTAASSNLSNLLHLTGILSPSMTFNSHNFAFILSAIKIYHIPRPVGYVLFLIDIIWQWSICIFFWITFYLFAKRSENTFTLINWTFGLSIALWCTFVILEELFIAYKFESVHMRLIILNLLSLLFIHLVPANQEQSTP